MRLVRRILALTVTTTLALVLARPSGPAVSLARYVEGDASVWDVAADTLDPPTNLAATGGSAASLSWTITPDAYAAGYELQRAAVSGGPYTVVASVTPRTSTSTTNTPPSSGTWFYVLRSAFQNWASVDSNQASAVVTIGGTATGYHGCTALSNAADTGGQGNGYELLALNACGDDLLVATDTNTGTNFNTSCTNSGKDRHRFWDFNLGVPASVAAVAGIQVRVDSGMNNNGGTNNLCVELSWDGGTSWTTARSFAMVTSAITTYALGGPADTWGRTWTGANFSNANFRIRVTDASSQPNKNYLLEYLAVQVIYTP